MELKLISFCLSFVLRELLQTDEWEGMIKMKILKHAFWKVNLFFIWFMDHEYMVR